MKEALFSPCNPISPLLLVESSTGDKHILFQGGQKVGMVFHICFASVLVSLV